MNVSLVRKIRKISRILPIRLLPRRFHVFLTVALVIGLFGCDLIPTKSKSAERPQSKTKQEGNSSARIGFVKKNDIAVKATASGRIVSARSTTIKAPYTGFIQNVFVKVGDKVKRGDPLLAISEGVDEKGAQPFPMRAPFAGTVVEAAAQSGQQVEANKGGSSKEYLLRIEDCSSYAVEAEFPEIDATRVGVGMQATIRLTALPQKTYPGVLTSLNLAASQDNKWMSNRVLFPGTIQMSAFDDQIRPGLSALVDVEIAERKGVLTLGHEYIASRAGGFFVTRADGTEVNIKLGLQNESGAEIIEGVSEGDRIMVVDYMNREAKAP